MNLPGECWEMLSSEHGMIIASMGSKQLLSSARTVVLQDGAHQYPIMDERDLRDPIFY